MPGRARRTGTTAGRIPPGNANRPGADDTSNGQYYLIGDAAGLTGLTAHTLRAWERVGLLSPRRSSGGVRHFTEDDLARIRLIARTLDARRLSRRAVAVLLASGDLRPDAMDYQPSLGAKEPHDDTPDDAGNVAQRSGLQHAPHEQGLLDAFVRVDEAVASSATLDEVLTVVCRECCEAFGVPAALLWLVEAGPPEDGSDESSGKNAWLVLAAGYGPVTLGALRGSPRPRVRLSDPRALMTQALQKQRAVQIRTLTTFAMAHPELPHLLPAAALAALPLLGRSGEPIGVLTLRVVESSHVLSDDDLRRAQIFANAAAMAIQSSRLEERLRTARQRAHAGEQRHMQRERCLAAVTRAAAEAQGSGGEEGRGARVLAAFVAHAGAPVVSASLHLLDRERGVLRRVGMFGSNAAVAAVRDEQAIAEPRAPRLPAWTSAPLYSGSDGAPPPWYDDKMRAAWPTTSIRSWAAVPLLAGGELYGALTVGFGVRHLWDAAERTWMEACADTVALALESERRVAGELRQAHELASVLESISEGITVIDVDGRTLMRNAAAEAITARGAYQGDMSESAGVYGLRDALTGAPLPYERTPLARALRGETVRDAALLMRDDTGRDRHIFCSSGPVRDERGHIVAAVTVFRDATAQMRPARLFERLGQQLGTTLEPDEEMRVLAHALTEVGGLDTVAIYTVEPDGHGLRLVAAHNYPPEAQALAQRIPADAPTIAALALRTGQPHVVQRPEQTQGEEHALTRRLAEALGVASGAAVPLLARGRVVGVLVAASYQAEAFLPDEVAMLLELAGVAGLAVDNAQLYQTARRTAAELDAIINAMADPVWVTDASGTLTRTNQAAEEVLGAQAGSAPGDPLDQSGPLLRALQGEPVADEGRPIHPPDGGTRWLQTSSAPIRDDATGSIVGAVAVGHDITHLREMQRMREEFLAVVAHELRTPLTSLLGFVQASLRNASRQSGGPQQERMPAAEVLARVERQALRLDRLVGDLLDFVRIQQGRLQYRWTIGDVAGAVAEAVDEQRAAHPDRRVELSLPETPLPARFDPDRLGQVVTNLLTNALKYSRVDQSVGVCVEITPAATEQARQPREAVVRVRDRGPGIPREHLAHLFERFYRVPGVEVQSGSGIGLGVGLYVAHEIVQRHGGRIWAESEPDQGSIFTFTVPLLAE